MPTLTDDFVEAPTDERLRELRAVLDQAEEALADARTDLAEAIRAANDGGVPMTHIASVVGWSRQWCYNALKGWLRD